jgi:aromatic ring-opening dioxygenase LigB subunit
MVIFDDFYKNNPKNSNFGCNKIIDHLKNKYFTQILSLTDQIVIKGKDVEVNMVLVKKR